MKGFRRVCSEFIALPRRYHGLAVACGIWLLWMIVGFWRMLLLVVLAAIGYIVGRILEENQSWRRLLDKLLSDKFTE